MIVDFRRCSCFPRWRLELPQAPDPGGVFLFLFRDGGDGASEIVNLSLEDFVDFCVAARVYCAFAGFYFHFDALDEVCLVDHDGVRFRVCWHGSTSLRAGLHALSVSDGGEYEKRYGSSVFAGTAGCYSSVYV